MIGAPFECPACQRHTTVYAQGTDGAYTNNWKSAEWCYDFKWGHIINIVEMDRALASILKKRCPNFHKARVGAFETAYWLNHCDQCGRQIDHDLLYSWNDSSLFCPSEQTDTSGMFLENIETSWFTLFQAARNYQEEFYALYIRIDNRPCDC